MASLYQLMLMVGDMAKMVAFYRDAVGLEVVFPSDAPVDGYASVNWVQLAAGETRLALHGGGEPQGSGAATLSFKVDDVAALYRNLKQKGFEIDAPQELGPGVMVAKALDPEGNRLSFDQTA